jgi:hypothetical protein
MAPNLEHPTHFGESVWIDWPSRDLLASGRLQELVDRHAAAGVTATNPKILDRDGIYRLARSLDAVVAAVGTHSHAAA